MSVKLRCVFWNINGRMQFLTSDFISSWLDKNCDVLFVTETHLCKCQKFKLKKFLDFHSPFSDAGVRYPRGGVSCFVVPSILRYIENIDRDTPELIIVRFIGGDTLFSTYIAPSDSSYYHATDFNRVCNILKKVSCECIVVGVVILIHVLVTRN